MPVEEWVRYDLGLPEVTDADLDSLESARGVTLPADFRSVMIEHAGDRPLPGVTTVGRGDVSSAEMFVVKADKSGRAAYNIWSYIERFEEYLPPETARRLIPFTSNGGQAVLALDYRAGESPKVALVDLDVPEEPEALIVVADSFAAWLDGLHD